MKKTLPFFLEDDLIQTLFLLESFSLGQVSFYSKFHHPSSCSFWDSYEEDLKFVYLEDNLNKQGQSWLAGTVLANKLFLAETPKKFDI